MGIPAVSSTYLIRVHIATGTYSHNMAVLIENSECDGAVEVSYKKYHEENIIWCFILCFISLSLTFIILVEV